MKLKANIIMGLFFGDEGKGKVISKLSNRNSLTIRFNGGQQAGHTVESSNFRHVFSNFGSGTYNGSPTFWSKYCTFYPSSFMNEHDILSSKKIKPIFYIDPLCPVTTPMDVYFNKNDKENRKHGTVGMGFGSTLKRHDESPIKLFVRDLQYRVLLEHKIQNICDYYEVDINSFKNELDNFYLCVDDVLQIMQITSLENIYHDYDTLNFEGAQGIQLDMDHGFFPNVTRSNTYSKNAIEILKELGINSFQINAYYCMRSYLTRHGNGFLPNEQNLGFEDLTNVYGDYQGHFRQGYHSKDMLFQSLDIDSNNHYENKYLVLSHLDQTQGKILMDDNKLSINELKGVFGNKCNILGFPEYQIIDNTIRKFD